MSRARGVGFAVVTILALIFLSPTLGYFAGFLDEGMVLEPAVRVLEGQVAYRDVYLLTTPVPIYLYALFMKVFGDGTMTASVCLWLIRGLGIGALYLVGCYIVSPLAAAIPSAVLLLTFSHESFHLAYHWVANLTLCLALAGILWSLEKPTRPRLLMAGIAVAVAGMSMQTVGVLLLVVGVVAYRFDRVKTLWWGIGVSAGAAPWFIYFGLTGATADFFRDIIASNLHRASHTSVNLGTFFQMIADSVAADPWYTPTAILLLLPPLVGTFGPLFLRAEMTRSVTVVYWASVLLLLHSYYRLFPSQLLLHGFLSVLMTVWVFNRMEKTGKPLAVGLLLLALPDGLGFVKKQTESERVWLELPRGRVWVHSRQEAESLARLRDFFKEHVQPGEAVFLMPYVPGLYYFLDLKGATRYVQMRSRQYSEEQMLEALEDLRKLNYPKIFNFPIYESEQFLLQLCPDDPPQLYFEQRDWFHDRLFQHYRKRDFGALWILEPLVSRDAP